MVIIEELGGHMSLLYELVHFLKGGKKGIGGDICKLNTVPVKHINGK